jgi:transcriptional regulator
MYVPEHFVVEDRRELVAFMREHRFATLVSIVDGRPIGSHLPFTIHESVTADLLLTAHMAKANPHWKALGEGEALVIFAGPHAYVSPSLYESKLSVPTWNYATVHAYGTASIVSAVPVLEQLIEQVDPAYRAQWDALPEEFKAKMVNGVVAFEIAITSLEGKYKLSQNRPKADQTRVTQSFQDTELGQLMARWLES